MPKYLITVLLVLASNRAGYGQYVQAGTQIPLNYTLGGGWDFSKRISAEMRTGILTFPFDRAILAMLQGFGTDAAITNTIGNAFDFGVALQPSLDFHLGKYHLGAEYAYHFLRAKDPPAALIESYYGVTLPRRLGSRENTFVLVSHLHAAGIRLGRVFDLSQPGWELKVELAVSKVFASSSVLSGDFGDMQRASALIDAELNRYYIDYGYLPSLNVFLVRRFGT